MENKSTKKMEGALMIHLGCGEKYIPGFIHVDIRKMPHVDYVASADNLSFLKEGSADLIYACHLLEHFKRSETLRVLKEWHRVLKKGGVLRVAVPDFESLVKIYKKSGDINLILGPLVGRQDYEGNTHFRVFDFKSLSALLVEAGFKNVHRYDWKKTVHKDYDDYSQAYIPHMDKENGTLISLNIECEK